MRKVKIIAVSLIIMITLLPCWAYGVEEKDYYSEQLEASGAKEIYRSLDGDIQSSLDELGIEDVNFQTLFDISPSNAFGFIKNIVKGKAKEPLKVAVKLMGIIIFITVGEAFIPDNEKMNKLIRLLSILMSISVLSVPIYQAMSSAISSIGLCCVFIKALIPVMAGIVIASGSPLLAISFQSWAFAAVQFISSACEGFIVPIVGTVTALDISGAIMPSFKLGGVTSLIKKTVIAILSFTATIYVSFLGIKGALSTAADGVAAKGIKLIISSAVPVVGGALSEAYSGIMGSLVLVKSTVGIFGIIVIAIITLPSVIELLLWIFVLKLGTALSSLFSCENASSLMSSLCSALTLLNVVVIFNAVLFIISMALLLVMKA